jgi:hypothetical protein
MRSIIRRRAQHKKPLTEKVKEVVGGRKVEHPGVDGKKGGGTCTSALFTTSRTPNVSKRQRIEP